MKSLLSAALIAASLALGCGQVAAQGAGSSSAEARRQTLNNAQIFYQVLLGEMSAASGDTGAAISLLLDAARKTQDEALFQRATDLALGARAGETALQVVRSWRQAFPKSLPAARYQLQILTAINRVSDSAESLRAVIELTPASERNQVLALVPALYARASDKKLAASVIEQSLAAALADAQSSASAWSAVGRARLAAGDSGGALEAVQRALAADARSRPALGLALDLMTPGQTQAEALVRRYLDGPGQAEPQVRIDYVRNLLDQQRYAESAVQLRRLTTEHPQFPEAWLMLGSLQMDQPQSGPAEASLKRYLDLTESTDAEQAAQARRGRGQAYLMLAQMAERRGDLSGASNWLDRVEDRDLMVQTQARRASLLARRGQLAQGRALLQKLPESTAQDARRKLLAEVNLLREFKDHRSAYELMQKAVTAAPQDHELIYEKSLLAEKLGRIDEMEQLLRRVMQIKPDYHAAYNALGYSLADRGLRLQEARQLIQKALQFAPDDPYIQDSLAWVEFRLGNAQEALRVIEIAYKSKPDAEIAAHFGEILWSLGQRERARLIWREGLMLNADNDTLQETLKRLQVTP
ncbi:MAG: tetratricopeptide repeat protein [Betaproteobacteria bacterium]|nr:tetratricopeptide repeat protein [Betaproteobacteria bacterium]